MNREDKNKRQILERSFWRAEYTKRRATCEIENFRAKILNATSYLIGECRTLYPNNIAILSKIMVSFMTRHEESQEPPLFDLSMLNEEQLAAVKYLGKMSVRFGYFAYTIIEPISSTYILNCSLNHETVPFHQEQFQKDGLPPFPLSCPNPNNTREVNCVKTIKKDSAIQSDDSVFTKLGLGPNINLLFCIDALADDYNHQAVIGEIERQVILFRGIQRNIRDALPPKEEEIETLCKLAKRGWENQYRSASYHARSVGLWLWDYANVNKVGKSEAIKEFRKRGLDKGIEKYNESGETRLGNYYNNTCKCIKSGEVLPIG